MALLMERSQIGARGEREGVAVPVLEPIVREAPGGEEARRMHRNAQWHRQIVEGFRLPNGRVVRDTVDYVAWLDDVDPRTIERGIARHIAYMETIRNVAAAECLFG